LIRRLEQREVRLAVLVERDHLAVDDRLLGRDPASAVEERPEVAGRVLLDRGSTAGRRRVDDRLHRGSRPT
jgi:hypothetical protein